MLDADGRTLFAHAVASFTACFASHPFRFICRGIAGTPDVVATECVRLGIARHRCVVLDAPTAGQAETVALGLERGGVAAAEPVTIFKIDTFRPGFCFPAGFELAKVDGYRARTG